jgi:hypothetical protein
MRIVGLEPRPARGRHDEEHATTVDSVLGSSTMAPSHIHTTGHRVSGDDALALFRLMLGITAAPHLGFTDSPLRPADNVGLYARVVRSEQTSKDNYRVFSAAINACYFLQIIVAAALTALGAANADNKAVTAFGAINTGTMLPSTRSAPGPLPRLPMLRIRKDMTDIVGQLLQAS